jgi:hypothetical protein
MTLRCECGGPVRVQCGTPPAESDSGFFELYECQSCGRTGTYRVERNPHREHLGGCLEAK